MARARIQNEEQGGEVLDITTVDIKNQQQETGRMMSEGLRPPKEGPG